MAETTITVQGEAETRIPAERARVSAGVHAWGPDRESVFTRAVEAADAISALTEPLATGDTGAVRSWSKERVRVWSERPWNNEGKQLDPVQHAALDVQAVFADFDALARWVEQVAVIPDAQLSSIEWELTDETRLGALAGVRADAVADAIAKATTYANAIGLTTVAATAVADPGMLGDGGAPGGGGPMQYRMSAMKASDSMGAPLEFRPEPIVLSASVDARFSAHA